MVGRKKKSVLCTNSGDIFLAYGDTQLTKRCSLHLSQVCYYKTSLALHQRRQARHFCLMHCSPTWQIRLTFPPYPLPFSSPALAPMRAVVVGTCHVVARFRGLYSVILTRPCVRVESTQQRQHILTGWYYYYYSNCMIVSQSHSVFLITFILFY